MKILLLKYNKVTTEAFQAFADNSDVEVVWGDLTQFGDKIDRLSPTAVFEFMNRFLPVDAVMTGDIFWPTGQNICSWCHTRKIKCFFLQHGQWIYIENKKSPPHLPNFTLVYGENIKGEIDSWPYGKRSKVVATGNPRYDKLPIEEGDYVYFSPPVTIELNPSARSITHPRNKAIQALSGLDKKCKLMIQPHYREGKISFLRSWFPNAELIDPMVPALPLLARSKCILTHRNSTMVLDGIASQKRIVIMPDCESRFSRGHFDPFTVETNNLSEVVLAVTASYDAIDDYELTARPHVNLGGASGRIEQLIKEAVSNGSS